jgi:phosphoglycolate phosphatase-like HAD superfamily hydrolase
VVPPEELGSPEAFQFLQKPERGCRVASSLANEVVIIVTDAAVVDADETLLDDTLEQLHDGLEGRFAWAVRVAALEKGVVLNREDLERDDLWTREFRTLSGLTEEGWLDGLAARTKQHFKIDVTSSDIGRAMSKVLTDSFEEFLKRVAPVELGDELAASIASRGIGLALCTTTKEEIIRPFLDVHRLLVHYRHLEFDAQKKEKDPTGEGRLLFSGQGVLRACAALGVAAENATMFGDSIADWGAAAKAGVRNVVLRLPNYAVKGPGGREKALAKLMDQIAKAQSDNADDPNFALVQTAIVDSFGQVRILGRTDHALAKQIGITQATNLVGSLGKPVSAQPHQFIRSAGTLPKQDPSAPEAS